MKQKITLLCLIILISSSHLRIVAQGSISFEEAFAKSKAIEKYKLDLKTDDLQVIRAQMAENSIAHFNDLAKKYDLRTTFDEKLENEIIKDTSVAKANLGKEIASRAHLLELNTRYSNYRKLYIAAMKAKFDLELAREKRNFAKDSWEASRTSYELGKVIQIELDIKYNEYQSAQVEFERCEHELSNAIDLLNYYLNADVILKEEEPIFDELESLEHYLNSLDDRFELFSLKKKNEIIKLETDIYDEKYNALSPHNKAALTKKEREYRLNTAQMQINQLAISDEITRGYNEMMSKGRELQILKDKVQNLEKRSVNMQNLYDTGKISKLNLFDFKLKHMQAKHAYQLMVIDYNNFYKNFMNAVSVGPALY